MTPAQIIAALELAQSLFSAATSAYNDVKTIASADDQATITGLITSSGTHLDTARQNMDAAAA
jgi:hypothetical protein